MERITNNTLLRYLLDRRLISKQQHSFIRKTVINVRSKADEMASLI